MLHFVARERAKTTFYSKKKEQAKRAKNAISQWEFNAFKSNENNGGTFFSIFSVFFLLFVDCFANGECKNIPLFPSHGRRRTAKKNATDRSLCSNNNETRDQINTFFSLYFTRQSKPKRMHDATNDLNLKCAEKHKSPTSKQTNRNKYTHIHIS